MDQSYLGQLHAELRNYIYKLVFSQSSQANIVRSVHDSDGLLASDGHVIIESDGTYIRALTSVCKQARSESLGIFFSVNSFDVRLIKIYRHMIRWSRELPKFDTILRPLTSFLRFMRENQIVLLGKLKVTIGTLPGHVYNLVGLEQHVEYLLELFEKVLTLKTRAGIKNRVVFGFEVYGSYWRGTDRETVGSYPIEVDSGILVDSLQRQEEFLQEESEKLEQPQAFRVSREILAGLKGALEN